MLRSHCSIQPSLPYSPSFLPQKDTGCPVAPLPKLRKFQCVPHGPRYFQSNPVAPTDDLTSYVDHLPAKGGRVCGHRHDPATDILLERLIQKKGDGYQDIVGGVQAKPLKGKPLVGKLLKRPEGQFTSTSVMIATK